MEAWLKSENGSFKFPFVPQNIPCSDSYNIATETLSNGNEVSYYAGKGLRKTSISAHFPSDKDRTYLDGDSFIAPEECVRIIDSIAQSHGEIRYIVTGAGVNMPVKIQSFEHNIVDATGDIHFSISMIEYNPPKAQSWTPPQTEESKKDTASTKNTAKKQEPKKNTKASTVNSAKRKVTLKNNRNNTKKYPRSYKASKKENVYDIAHKTTGNTRNYKAIMSINLNIFKPGSKFLDDVYTIKIPQKKQVPSYQPRMYNPILNRHGASANRSRFYK